MASSPAPGRRQRAAPIVAFGALVLVVLFLWWARASELVGIDSCLDFGGAWRDGVCVGARPAG